MHTWYLVEVAINLLNEEGKQNFTAENRKGKVSLKCRLSVQYYTTLNSFGELCKAKGFGVGGALLKARLVFWEICGWCGISPFLTFEEATACIYCFY